jgi:hypothetical protein
LNNDYVGAESLNSSIDGKQLNLFKRNERRTPNLSIGAWKN